MGYELPRVFWADVYIYLSVYPFTLVSSIVGYYWADSIPQLNQKSDPIAQKIVKIIELDFKLQFSTYFSRINYLKKVPLTLQPTIFRWAQITLLLFLQYNSKNWATDTYI